MGLSSSQARLLTLTSRMHQIEYKAAKLEAQKLQMANESRRVYDDYLIALEQTKVQVKTLNSDGSAGYKDISSYQNLIDAGYALYSVDKDRVYNGSLNTTEMMTLAMGAGLLSEVMAYTNGGAGGPNLNFKLICNNEFGTDFSDSVDVNTAIVNLIETGRYVLVQKKENGQFPTSAEVSNYETSVATNTGLQEVADETMLRKAEAKYEADMRKIDAKDRKYDMDLAALETERNAIKSEMETLKTVAKDNVERTFKLFS